MPLCKLVWHTLGNATCSCNVVFTFQGGRTQTVLSPYSDVSICSCVNWYGIPWVMQPVVVMWSLHSKGEELRQFSQEQY